MKLNNVKIKKQVLEMWDKEQLANECVRQYLKYRESKEKIDKAIKYIEQYCIDDEFYVNLTKKEKCIIDVLLILKGKYYE